MVNMVKEKLNVAVIGLGSICEAHLTVYDKNPNVNIYAVCDLDKNWAEKVAAKYNVENVFTDYKELLKDKNIDAVSVCLPTYLHAEATINALDAGKHVLCEKPMAINAQEAVSMKNAAEKNNKKLMISQNQRFGKDIQLLKKYATEGFFGDIYLVRIGWRRPYGSLPSPFATREDGTIYSNNWFNEIEKGGGVLRDLGSHLLDLTMYITDFPELDTLNSSCYRKFYPKGYDGSYICNSEDLACSQMKFKNGMTIQLEVSHASFVEEQIVFTEIYGTKGGASRRSGLKLFTNEHDTNMVREVKEYKFESKKSMDRFIDSIIEDRQTDVPPEQGVKVIELIDAIYNSAGKIIT